MNWHLHRPTRSRVSFALTLLLLIALLAGCAAQSAFRSGNHLIAEGKVPDGLSKLQEASQLAPDSLEYRVAYLQAKERALASTFGRAEEATRRGRYDEAELLFRQALLIPGASDNALTGLRRLDDIKRRDAAVTSATDAVKAGNWTAARALLRPVLAEDPQHSTAAPLMRQIDSQLSPPATEPALAAAYRKPISIEFKDAALKLVFDVISRSSGLSFVFDKDVRTDQKTSIFLRHATVDAAIQLTLATNQLEQRVLDENTVLIYPNTQAKQKDYQQLVIKSFYLANADAKSVSSSLKTLLRTRDIVVDEKLNMIILRESPEVIRLAEKLVALHDLPDAEVMLEVEILEVKRSRLLDLGVQWPDHLTLAPLSSRTDGAVALSDLRHLNGSSVSAALGSASINAKKTDSDTNLLANPRIRVRNREKAKILIGDRVPNITTTSTSTGFVADSVNYVDVGLKLDVEPTVYLDGEVAIKVSLEVSSIVSQIETKSGSRAYQIGTRNANTVLRLKDGENQVLAGLINDEDRQSARKVPGVGELPLVGRLFGAQLNDSSKTEIVLSITPRIIRTVTRPEASMLEFDSGTESSARMLLRTETKANNIVAKDSSTLTLQVPTPTASLEAPPISAPPPPALPPGKLELRWDGPTNVKAGEVFTVRLMGQADGAVSRIPVTLAFDPQALAVQSVTEGDLLPKGGSSALSTQLDMVGSVVVNANVQGPTGSTGSGAIIALTLKAIEASGSPRKLQIRALQAFGPDDRALVLPDVLPSYSVTIAP